MVNVGEELDAVFGFEGNVSLGVNSDCGTEPVYLGCISGEGVHEDGRE